MLRSLLPSLCCSSWAAALGCAGGRWWVAPLPLFEDAAAAAITLAGHSHGKGGKILTVIFLVDILTALCQYTKQHFGATFLQHFSGKCTHFLQKMKHLFRFCHNSRKSAGGGRRRWRCRLRGAVGRLRRRSSSADPTAPAPPTAPPLALVSKAHRRHYCGHATAAAVSMVAQQQSAVKDNTERQSRP